MLKWYDANSNTNYWLLKLTCLAFLLLVLQTPLKAQYGYPLRKPAKVPFQSTYIEFLGNGILYSINYDVIFRNNLGFRLGGSVYGTLDDNQRHTYNEFQRYFTILFMGNYYVGHKSNRLELGLGFVEGEIDKSYKIQPPGLTMTVAYRYLPIIKDKYTFKIGFTPTISHRTFYPLFGIAFGIKIGNFTK